MTTDEHLPEARLPEELEAPAPVTAEGISAPVTAADIPPQTPTEPLRARVPWPERSVVLFCIFFVIALGTLAVAYRTVHQRNPEEHLVKGGSTRSHVVLSHWLNEGYFHYVGLVNRDPSAESIYRNSTGGYMVSGFVVEKLYSLATGHYSYRLLAVHNQIVSAILCALAGLLSYRMARRFGLETALAFAVAGSVVVVLFTFPDNLELYWEMSAQAYGLLFALLYLLIEERSLDLPKRPRLSLIAQALTVFLISVMESMFCLGFVAAIAATVLVVRRDGSWKRFVVIVFLPWIAAIALYQWQLRTAAARFPNAPTTGSQLLWRTGLDGELTYYSTHLDIANHREVARGNWPEPNRQWLFRWKWVFILGSVATLAVLIAYARDRAPRFALELLAWLIGGWFFYAAIFSQAFVIHPYLYDVLLFTPMCIAVFALGPSLLESLTKRSGAIVLMVVFGAFWYSFFQLRLYAIRWPLPKEPPPVAAPAPSPTPAPTVK